MPQNKIITTQPIVNSKNPNVIQSPNINIIPSKVLEPESMPQDDSQSRFLASLLSQGAGMFGAALQGENVMKAGQVFESNRDYQNKLNEQKKQIESLTNPESDVSKRKRLVYERALGIKIPGEFSASDLEDRNVLQGLVAQSQPKPVQSRVGGGVSQPKEVKQKEESKDQKQADIFTSNTETIKKQLEDYRNAIKAIKSPIGYAAEKAKAESIANSLLLKIKTAEKTGALDTGSISIIQSITGSPDYTRNEVIDARINQALKNLNDNVENELRGTGTINKYYKPYIPPEINDPREKAIIENYYSNPNDPENLQMYQDLINKKGY